MYEKRWLPWNTQTLVWTLGVDSIHNTQRSINDLSPPIRPSVQSLYRCPIGQTLCHRVLERGSVRGSTEHNPEGRVREIVPTSRPTSPERKSVLLHIYTPPLFPRARRL